MPKIQEFVKIAVESAQSYQKKGQPKSSQIFNFPLTDDFVGWIENQILSVSYGSRPSWKNWYLEMIRKQIRPQGIIIPKNWEDNLLFFQNDGFFVIADDKDNVIEIGRSRIPVIVRFFDLLVPPKSNKYPAGQPTNRAPYIWEEILKKGKIVKCFFCYDLDFLPTELVNDLRRQIWS